MAKDLSALWVEKYRPQYVDDYIFQDKSQRRLILQMVADMQIPHLLLSGIQGAGKTTLARVLINELDIENTDILIINASDETGVDHMRDKIKSFVSTFAMGSFKIVNLEEADYLSPNAQAILRQIMEQYSDSTRFILTCNYDNKIIPAIKSRCQHFHFKAFDKEEIVDRVESILAKEHISFERVDVDNYVAIGYPDIRKIINLVQQNSFSGKLIAPSQAEEAGDYKFKLLDLLSTDNWLEIRKLLCANVAAEEWEGVYRFLYENLNKSTKFSEKPKWEKGIVIIADHLFKHGIVADPELNAAAMFIRLAQI